MCVCVVLCGVVCSCMKVRGGMEADRGRKKMRGNVTEKVLCLNKFECIIHLCVLCFNYAVLMCVALGCGTCILVCCALCLVVWFVVVLSVYGVYSCMWRLLWTGQLELAFCKEKV